MGDDALQLPTAAQAAEFVPQGRTAIDLHPEREAIVTILCEYYLTPRGDRITLSALAQALETEFGVHMDLRNLHRYLEKRIVPAVIVTPAWVKRGIIEGEFDLNTVKMKLQLAKQAYEEATDPTASTLDEDEGVRLLNPQERAVLVKTALAALNDAESSMERFGVIPGKKVTVEKHEIKADLSGAMRARAGRGPIIEGTATATKTTTTVEG